LMIPQCRRHAGQQDSLLTIIRWEHDFWHWGLLT
jgi:hypothetical protein